MTDAITSAIQVALDGLSDRQTVTNNNIANVETPGYIAQTTDFETNLQKALNGNESVNLAPQHLATRPRRPTRNGNNVDIDNETVTAIDTEMRYEAMIEAMKAKFTILQELDR